MLIFHKRLPSGVDSDGNKTLFRKWVTRARRYPTYSVLRVIPLYCPVPMESHRFFYDSMRPMPWVELIGKEWRDHMKMKGPRKRPATCRLDASQNVIRRETSCHRNVVILAERGRDIDIDDQVRRF